MADYTQSKSTAISHQAVTHPNSVEGTPISVASAFECLVVCWHALVEATANTNPGKFRIFGSLDATGNNNWFHLLDIEVTDDNPATEPLNSGTGSEPAGSTVLEVASTTGFVGADNIYVQDNDIVASGEWHTVDKIVGSTSIDIMLGLAQPKASGDTVWGSAQQFRAGLNCAGLSRIRVDFSHEGTTGADAHVRSEVLVATDIE